MLSKFAAGTFGRLEIEQQLRTKMAQIDVHMAQLQALKKELQTTFDALRCAPNRTVFTTQVIAPDSGTGADASMKQRAFVRITHICTLH